MNKIDIRKKAVILVSGGLDSATVLALAHAKGYQLYALSFDYGQRHNVELQSAQKLLQSWPVVEHKVVALDLRLFGGSALTDTIAVPKLRAEHEITNGIPITYVPARNTIFLSIALGWSEIIGAWDIFLGVNAIDYSGYPDCRPEFIHAFEQMANKATAASVQEGKSFTIHTPLMTMTKADIIRTGLALGVNYAHTISCYDPTMQGLACGQCDACQLRLKGFKENQLQDPAPYVLNRA